MNFYTIPVVPSYSHEQNKRCKFILTLILIKSEHLNLSANAQNGDRNRNYALENYDRCNYRRNRRHKLCIACVWLTSANVISLKVWSITKIVINSNCDIVTLTEKIIERCVHTTHYIRIDEQSIDAQRLRCNQLSIIRGNKKDPEQIFRRNFFAIFFRFSVEFVFNIKRFSLLFLKHWSNFQIN